MPVRRILTNVGKLMLTDVAGQWLTEGEVAVPTGIPHREDRHVQTGHL